MNLSVGAKTDPGRRPNNEDQLAVIDVRRLRLRADGVLVIADGMGGRSFGERAASAAVETVQDTLVEMLQSDRAEAVNIGDALDSALRKANARVYEAAGEAEESRGMGTTCVAAVIEGDRLFLAHAGDSRAYLLRGQQLVRLTDDHSYVAEQVRAGTLSEESARRSRFRNVITRAVGIEPTIAPDLGEHDLQPNDWLLLCTDGLSNMVADPEIVQIITRASSAQDAADRLVNIANRNGGRDNITAIVARLEAGNRTQRMRKSDLAQAAGLPVEDMAPADEAPIGSPASVPAPRPANGTATPHALGDDETPTVPPRPRQPSPARPPASQGSASASAPISHVAETAPRPARGLMGLVAVLSLLLLAALAGALTLGHALTQDGYHLQLSPPFAVKPPPPPAPRPPDLSRVTYGAPHLLSPVPVQGEFLALAGDGSLTALSVSGQVLRLAQDGRVLAKYPLPKSYVSAVPAPRAASGQSGTPTPAAPRHWATDAQGNLYIADSAQRTLKKYDAQGVFLRALAPGLLHQPEAVAVGSDGAVYVVDAQRLQVFRPNAASPAVPANPLSAPALPGT